MSVGGIGPSSSSYSINDILKYTQPKQPSGFRRFLGAAVGGVANIFAPGVGSVIGGFISGSAGVTAGPGEGGLIGEASQFLELQRQIQAESRAFELASTVLKVKHDASLSAIRNMK